jgi:hypothetical protein
MGGMRTALGFRAHSGWAAMVAVAGTMESPTILERRRIEIADPKLPHSKQPYHAAAGLPLAKAENLLHEATRSSRVLAIEAISAIVESLESHGHNVAACGVLRGSGKPLPDVAAILKSHALIHTAEGVMFRDVLEWAARECRLDVTLVREKDIDSSSISRFASIGKLIGPPWTQDQKFATVAALIALAEPGD